MGALIRKHPWRETPLGPAELWPPALRTVVRFMLNTPEPIFIFWGEAAICLYNDAARSSLGRERHPKSLGCPAQDVFAEVWPLIGPQIDRIIGGGGGSFHENQMARITRDGKNSESFWTYSFGPIHHEETGAFGGILAVCVETTADVLNARALTVENTQRYSFFDRLPAFVGILRGPHHVYEYVNESYEKFVGRHDLIGRPVRALFPELEGQGFFEMLDGVYATGEPVVLQSVPIKFTRESPDRFMDLRYDPTYGSGGGVNGIFVSGHDLTDRVQAEIRREALAELSKRLHDLTTPADIAFVASALLGTTMQVSRVGYGTIDSGTDTLGISREWNAPDTTPLPPVVHLRDYGSFIDDLKRGDVVAISDVMADSRTVMAAEALQSKSARAFANVPLIEQNMLVAILYLNSADLRIWSSEDIAFIREFAERTRTAVERSRSDIALRALTASLEQQVDARTQERDRLWETSEDLLAIAGYDGTLFRISPSWTRSLGYDDSALLTRSFIGLMHPDDTATAEKRMADMLASGTPIRFESRVAASNGDWRCIAWSLVPEIDLRRINAVGRDITADREAEQTRTVLEEQLRQSQKMEAVGQLTGGIAHDFNNMLLGITGSLQIARRRLLKGAGAEIEPFLTRALTAANRAAALTHRLLAFSRRQPLDPRTIDANSLVGSLEDLFVRTVGERIVLQFVPATDLWATLCDPNQLESSLLNLVINARDAMPDGGALTIQTRNVSLDQARATELGDLAPGQYVQISVGDTGLGMAGEVVIKAFDPFFTTKPIGRGTGLGLSMVYGFARQSNGSAAIESIPGAGTTVSLYLPRRVEGAPVVTERPETAVAAPRGEGETILVIEDDAIVGSLVVDALTEIGYRVLRATDGHSGLALLQSDTAIHLLITDIGLPDLNGRQVADAAREDRPDLKILFMTGYAEVAAAASGFLAADMALIVKPFDIDDLTARVAAMIGQTAPTVSAAHPG